MSEASKSILTIIMEKVFPQTPDFFQMLLEQSLQVTHSVNRLVEFMETGDLEVGLTGREASARRVDADERGRADSIDRHARPFEAEEI